MADTDALRRFKPSEYPSIEAAPARALAAEIQRIASALDSVVTVMKKLEARMIAAGI